ncbi:MAG: amino acid aminotransferase [Planctomycetota bacterium]
MFEAAPLNPPDAIFGLIEQFKKDPTPNKINLSVGVYQNEEGVTPNMKSVHLAEEKLLAAEGTKSYLPIDGSPSYRDAVGRLVFGDGLVTSDQTFLTTAQTTGGTAALRVAGELLYRVLDVSSIWMSEPTWANHKNIFTAAGLELKFYRYLDQAGTGFDFEAMLESLDAAKEGQAILLHTVCHNPTGVDPQPEQWNRLFETIQEKSMIPIFDFAYQGFGESIEADATPIRTFAKLGECLVCNSFSKNFGLYAERVGGVSAVSSTQQASQAIQSQIKKMIRMMYSNPPLHGGAIVDTVLNDQQLRQVWEQELGEMRQRIAQLRDQFVAAMKERLPDRDFEYIRRQRGMFSYSGLLKEQVIRLREEHAIYALESGRINIAGINHKNIDRLCDAIAQVMS